MKTVSIIVPMYNAAQFINNCFRQICSQTYDNSSIECIFIDDGSCDESSTICNNLISSNKTAITFRLITHEFNKGVSVARNSGIDAAHNMYLFFMDIDDTISCDCIKVLIEATNQFPNADVICGNILTKKSNMHHHSVSEAFSSKDNAQNLHDTLLFIYASYSYNKLVLRKLVRNHRLYFPIGIPYFEDLHWNIDLTLNCQEIAYIPQVTYIYEDISTSAMAISCKRQKLVAECYYSLITKCLSLKESNCIIEKHLFIFHYTLLLLCMKERTIEKKTIKNIRNGLLKQSFKLMKPLLILYDLQLYQPFRYIAISKFVKNRSAQLRLWIYDKTK